MESPFLEPLSSFNLAITTTETRCHHLSQYHNFTMKFQTNFPWKFQKLGFHSILIAHTCVSNLLYAITPLRSPP